MDLNVSKESFIQYLEFEKRFSKHTLVAYSNDITQFFKFLETSYEIKTIEEINHTIVRSWIVSLMEQKITPRSVNRKITTLKSFYKYLLRQQLVTENPMLKIQSPKTSKRLPVFVEKEKMDFIVEYVLVKAHENTIVSTRIAVVFYIGLRSLLVK